MPFTPSTLYYVSSLLNAVSIPGRILFGIQYVDPAVDRISPTPELALGKATAKTAWDMVNGMLTALGESIAYPSVLASSCINCQHSSIFSVGGPAVPGPLKRS